MAVSTVLRAHPVRGVANHYLVDRIIVTCKMPCPSFTRRASHRWTRDAATARQVTGYLVFVGAAGPAEHPTQRLAQDSSLYKDLAVTTGRCISFRVPSKYLGRTPKMSPLLLLFAAFFVYGVWRLVRDYVLPSSLDKVPGPASKSLLLGELNFYVECPRHIELTFH